MTKLRLGDLGGKEVINLGDGCRLGVIDDCDLVFEEKTGRISALLLPGRTGLLSVFGVNRPATIPWPAVRRIGDEVVIVDLNNAFEQMLPPRRREFAD